MTRRFEAALAALLVVCAASAPAQQTTTSKKPATRTARHRRPTAHKESATERELRELREQMINQQAQIDALKQQNLDKDKRLADATTDAANANAAANAATTQAQALQTTLQSDQTQIQTLNSDLSDLKVANVGYAQTLSDTKRDLTEKIESPTSLHYKGITITPVAFFALEGVWRQRSINSDINTPFNTTPFPGSNQGHVSELNLTGRQSRLGALFVGDEGPFKLSGYVEADFLSAGATSNANQSNSYTLRQRQIWGQAATKSGFTVTGGQMWSLVSENGKGTDNRTEKLPNTVDPQYHVGFSWTRQPGLRVQQKLGNPVFGSAVTFAAAIEQAQDQSFTAANAPSNFFFGGPGTAGGLYNVAGNYANNVAPDVIAKVAFDFPHSHFEVGGLARFDRARVYPQTVTATGVTLSPNGFNDTVVAGGGFGSARTSFKFVDLAVQGMFGDGTGRYGSSQLADLTVHPDGTLEPVRNYHGMASIETHPTRKLDIYAYYGGEYAQRTTYVNSAGTLVGYGVRSINDTGCNQYTPTTTGLGATGVAGSPATANCGSPTRYIQEGTFGYTYRITNSPKYGRLQYQFVYSYLTRQSWEGVFSGTYGTSTAVFGTPKAVNNMVFGGMRYYIP